MERHRLETKDLVIDDSERGIFRYHRSSLTSPHILELERDRIFDRCWLFLGHESEVEKPGDYRRRNVAGRPLFFVRGRDDRVRVFLNTCPHRGALICRHDEGNARVFQCFYHAWTFSTDGELVGMPDAAGYSEGFDRAEMGLRSPPRVDSYRGFYFVSFNRHVEDLRAYLAGAKEYIDLVADQSEEGMKVSRGFNKYAVRSNWKLMVENSTDGYHLMPVHRTCFEYLSDLNRDMPGESRMSPLENWDPGPVRALGNGHVVGVASDMAGRTVAHWHPLFGEDTKEEIAGIRERLVERFGEERTRQIADTNHSLLIFPNLLINDFLFTFIRVFDPAAPDRTEVTTWNLVPAEHSPNLLARRLENFVTFQGPGGFATPDDVEAVESSQVGFRAREMGRSDVSRGMHRQALTSDELQMRAFWRQWHGHLMGLDKVETADRIPEKT
ncbi:MAG: Rieske 2Fe-2S domain-containing protein [Dehalococcoidia bacterium]|nr:Rieske 2Fe-2S domain-containing protein [Dehalococcoidia bacterium]